MEQFVEYADQVRTNLLFTMAIKGCMGWNFSQWPYQIVSEKTCMDLWKDVVTMQECLRILVSWTIYQDLDLTPEVMSFLCMGIQPNPFIPI